MAAAYRAVHMAADKAVRAVCMPAPVGHMAAPGYMPDPVEHMAVLEETCRAVHKETAWDKLRKEFAYLSEDRMAEWGSL